MKTELTDQLRLHYRAIDSAQEPVDFLELIERLEEPVALRSRSFAPQGRRWLVAVAAFVVVLLAAIPFLVDRANDQTPVISQPTVTTTPPTTPATIVAQDAPRPARFETSLGTLVWTFVPGDAETLPDSLFVANPTGGYISQVGDWVSDDGLDWSYIGPLGPDAQVLDGLRWGEYRSLPGVFGRVHDGVWEVITIPLPEVEGPQPWVGGVATSGGLVVASGVFASQVEKAVIPYLWVSDDGRNFTPVQPPWLNPATVFALPGGGFGAWVTDPHTAGLGELWTSPDGAEWSNQGTPEFVAENASKALGGWTFDERAGKLFASYDAAKAGRPFEEWVSTDGSAWAQHDTPLESGAFIQETDFGYFTMFRFSDDMWASIDGDTWELMPRPPGPLTPPGAGFGGAGAAGDILYYLWGDESGTRVLWIGRFE